MKMDENTPTTNPSNVSDLTAISGDSCIVLHWTNPSDFYFDYVEITWTPVTGSGYLKVTGTKGIVETETIDGLSNGTEYEFTLKSVYTSGLESTGTTVRKHAFYDNTTGTPIVPSYTESPTVTISDIPQNIVVSVNDIGTTGYITANFSKNEDAQWYSCNSNSANTVFTDWTVISVEATPFFLFAISVGATYC